MKALRPLLLLSFLGAAGLPGTRAEPPDLFGPAPPILDPSRSRALEEGRKIFLQIWVEPQAEDRANDGLGPLFNAVSCSFCHPQEGGGHPPEEGGAEIPRLVRLSVPGTGGAFLPEPGYGGQIQDSGIRGIHAEARVVIRWEESAGRYSDGERYTLRQPRLDLQDLADGPLAPGTRISLRSPPPLFGIGLLEAVPDVALLALADPADANGDGISGRPNYVPDVRSGGVPVLGRFGWKANQPTIEQQNATALQEDLGITSDLFPAHACSPRQEACRTAKPAGKPELTGADLARLTLYTRLLAAPARRAARDPEVLRGEALFRQIGCEGCHHPRFETGFQAGLPELSGQTLHPYTDLLLHDLGPGLADGRPDFAADGTEWRTAPLWGLGSSKAAGREARLLHDGRARTAEEAILWHGGEAETSQDRFRKLSKEDRTALLRFLGSL
jgi:CxxC motif-containing protein (DUF1111 family)